MKTLKLKTPEPSEARLQDALMLRLRYAGYVVVRVNGGGFRTANGYFWSYIVQGLNASKGFPDVLALKDGRFRLFEVKRLGGKVSPEQERFAKFAKLFGVDVEVVEGHADLDALNLRA